MNILFLALLEIGGRNEAGKTHVFELAKSFVNLGHQVHLVTFGALNLGKHNNLFVYNASVRKRRSVNYFHKHLLLYVLFALRNKFLSFFKKDIDEPSYLSYLMKRIIKDKKIDLIYERHIGYDPGTLIGKEAGITTILELNGITPLELKERGFADDFISERLARELESMKRANKIVAVSKGVKDYYVSMGVDERKFSVVWNGVNLNVFQPKDKFISREKIGFDNSKYIGLIGTYRLYQGFEYAIKCMPYIVKEFPEAKMIIVGHSDNNFRPARSDLIELASNLGVVDNVTLMDARPYQEIPYYINAFDVCLLFREYPKDSSWPVKFFEYMACGKPVVCTNWESFKFIEEEKLGLLVDHRNATKTAQAIIKLLKDERTSQQMGERGLNYAKKYCSWDKIAMGILKIR